MNRTPLDIPGLSSQEVDRLVQYWEDRYPEKGRVLTEAVGPFYSPRLSLRPQPPASGLSEKATQVVFWSHVVGIRTVTPQELIEAQRSFHQPYKKHMGESLRQGLEASTQFQVGLIAPPLSDSFYCRGTDDYGFSLHEIIGDRVWYDFAGFRSLWAPVAAILLDCLECAAGLLILGAVDKNCRPLLDLWQSGNLPLGFDEGGKMVVLCS